MNECDEYLYLLYGSIVRLRKQIFANPGNTYDTSFQMVTEYECKINRSIFVSAEDRNPLFYFFPNCFHEFLIDTMKTIVVLIRINRTNQCHVDT